MLKRLVRDAHGNKEKKDDVNLFKRKIKRICENWKTIGKKLII